MLYVGLDLSRTRVDVHVLNEKGEPVEVTAVAPDAGGLRSLGRTKARRRADGPVLEGRHRCGRQAFRAVPRVRRLMSVLEEQAPKAFPRGDPDREATKREPRHGGG